MSSVADADSRRDCPLGQIARRIDLSVVEFAGGDIQPFALTKKL